MDDELEDFASSDDGSDERTQHVPLRKYGVAPNARVETPSAALNRKYAFVTPPRMKETTGHGNAHTRGASAPALAVNGAAVQAQMHSRSKRTMKEARIASTIDDIESPEDSTPSSSPPRPFAHALAARDPAAAAVTRRPVRRGNGVGEDIEGFGSSEDDAEAHKQPPTGLGNGGGGLSQRHPVFATQRPDTHGAATQLHDSGGKKRRRTKGPLGDQLRRALAAYHSDRTLWLHECSKTTAAPPSSAATVCVSTIHDRPAYTVVVFDALQIPATACLPPRFATVVSSDLAHVLKFTPSVVLDVWPPWLRIDGCAGLPFVLNLARALPSDCHGGARARGTMDASAALSLERRETFRGPVSAAATPTITSGPLGGSRTDTAPPPAPPRVLRPTPIRSIDPYQPAICIAGTVVGVVGVGSDSAHPMVAVEDGTGGCIVRCGGPSAAGGGVHPGAPGERFESGALRVVGRTRELHAHGLGMYISQGIAFILAPAD